MNENLGPQYFANAAVLCCVWPLLWLLALGMLPWIFGSAVTNRWPVRRRILASAAIFALGLLVLLKRSFDMNHGFAPAGNWSLGDVIARQFELLWTGQDPQSWQRTTPFFLELLGLGLSVPLVSALVLKVWLQWTSSPRDAEPERSAWARFHVSDFLVAIATAVCIAGAFDYPILPMLVLCVAALLAFPLINYLTLKAKEEAMNAENPAELAEERSRILKLLEDGKITASDAADLFGALASSRSAAGAPAARRPVSLDRKLCFAGAAIMLIAFFLPWFKVDWAAEMAAQQQNMASIQQALGASLPLPVQNFEPTSIAGGDIAHGLGWIALGLAVLAALIPSLLPDAAPAMRRNLRLLAVASGAIIVTYLLSSNARFASIGVVLALIGSGLQLLGVLLEARTLFAGAGYSEVATA
jgi:hypothetical protein